MKKKSIGIMLTLAAIAIGVSATSQAGRNQSRRTYHKEYRRGGLLGGGGFLGTGIGRSESDYYSDDPGLVGGVAQGTGEIVEGTGRTAGNILTFGAVSREERREARRREREERRRNRENYNNNDYNN